MPKKFRLGNVLLCDYVGKGQNNKHVLVNVYSGDVLVPAVPIDLAFGIYAELLADANGDMPDGFDMSVVLSGETILKGRGENADKSKPSSTLIIQMFTCVVAKEGAIELVLSAPGYSRVTALSKRISVGRP